EQYHDALKAQGVPQDHLAMKCPMCGVIQSAASLITAGAGATFDDVQKFLGFSCVGRFTDASAPRKKPDGKPCDWTLGGLFRVHKLEVVTPDGKAHPRFELATPEEAQALMRSNTCGHRPSGRDGELE
ncbi:MAG: VVA0879 family protein, partial [Burkholderiales bacterium]